jgi:hypothetical protein
MLRSSVLLAAFAWFLMALESFVSVCFLSLSIIWTATAASPCGSGLKLAPSILWTARDAFPFGGGLAFDPMMAIPIIRQPALQSDGEMLAVICIVVSFFSPFFF